MIEKIVHYKWIILIVGLMILNFGWNLYSNESFNQEVSIKENGKEQTIDKVSVVAAKQIVDENQNEEEAVQYAAESGWPTPQEMPVANETKHEDAGPIEVPVYICGEIVNPGVYYVEESAIINEVVEKSGGFTNEADTKAINLASPIQPNEKIIVPKQGEQIDKSEDSYENRERAETLPSSQTISTPLSAPSNESQSSLMNINTATKEQLMTLNGIGEVKADAIIAYRQENSGFKSIEEIMHISGIGEKTFEKIKQFITT